MSLKQDKTMKDELCFLSAKAQKVESEEKLLLETKKWNSDLESVEILILWIQKSRKNLREQITESNFIHIMINNFIYNYSVQNKQAII